MHLKHALNKVAGALAATVLAIVLTTGASFAASEFAGTWKTKDTQGKPMEITLADDGAATGSREGESLEGTWKARKHAAVIRWSDGWTTKIVERDGKFRKLAYEKGKEPKGKPTHAAPAEKAE